MLRFHLPNEPGGTPQPAASEGAHALTALSDQVSRLWAPRLALTQTTVWKIDLQAEFISLTN